MQKAGALTEKQKKALSTIKEMPGLTTKDLATLLDSNSDVTKALLRRMSQAGLVHSVPGNNDGTVGRTSIVWHLGSQRKQAAKPEPKEKAEPVTGKPVDVTVVWKGPTHEELLDTINKLKLWQERAILRFPELKVDPVVLEAREVLASHMPDEKQKNDCLAGLLDKRPPMLALIEALSR